MNLTAVTPQAYAAMTAFDDAASRGLDDVVGQLVRIRASQLNRCAFCVDMHTRQARAAGETAQRLDLLTAWRRASCYTERERAALAVTEAVTALADDQAVVAAYHEAKQHYDDTEFAHLLWTVAAINAWNRTAVAAGMTAPPRERSEPPAALDGATRQGAANV